MNLGTVDKFEKLKKEVETVRQKVLQLDDSIREKKVKLHKEKEDHTKDAIKKERAVTHSLNTLNDKLNRPSDQSRMIRDYGRMDVDLWTRNEVRWWFNKNAPNPKNVYYEWSAVENGYMVPANRQP